LDRLFTVLKVFFKVLGDSIEVLGRSFKLLTHFS
jgi:hypothetical protein